MGTVIRKQNDHQSKDAATDRITLPLPPTANEEDKFEMEVYARFMRHMRHVPGSRMEIKILSSIQFTADMIDCSDALISKTLVDLGLRAPRRSFPASFLDFADRNIMRASWKHGRTQPSIKSLKTFWNKIGEDRFTSARRSEYALCQNGIFAAV